jgi:hypothetical protein
MAEQKSDPPCGEAMKQTPSILPNVGQTLKEVGVALRLPPFKPVERLLEAGDRWAKGLEEDLDLQGMLEGFNLIDKGEETLAEAPEAPAARDRRQPR